MQRDQKDQMKCPCEECPFYEDCPDMYACPDWVEWAMQEE